MRPTFFVACTLACLSVPQAVTAQNATVQQPVFGQFGVGTTVVVPDRGRSFIGGVSGAGEARSRFGPFYRGSTYGMFRNHSGVSTSVTIQDLRAMDQMILQQGKTAPIPKGPRLSGNGEHAYGSLVRKYAKQSSGFSRAGDRRIVSPRSRDTGYSASISRFRTTEPRGDMYYRFALRAESQGNKAAAYQYYKLAARNGSRAAAAKLYPNAPTRTASSRR